MRKTLLPALILATVSIHARQRVVATPTAIRRVFIVIMENENYESVIQRPFAARLAQTGALLADSQAIGHPSLPNYIALVSGNTWGFKDDTIRVIDVPHLGDLLEARGLTWRTYAERYPGNCNLSNNLDHHLYVRRHVPFLMFANVVNDRPRCAAHIVNAKQLDADIAANQLPNVAFYIPDQNHNGHDSDPDTADAWLDARFTPLLKDARFMDGTLFILTYDESRTSRTTHIATIFAGAAVKPGAISRQRYDHYDLLRTVEDLFGLGTLGQEDRRTGELIRDVFVP